MAKSKNPNEIAFTTPRAPAVYPKLDLANPDYGTEEHAIEGGNFSCQIRVLKSDPAVKALLGKLEKLMEISEREAEELFAKLPVAARKKLKDTTTRNEFVTECYDEDENETGEIILKFKMKHSGVVKKTGKAWKRYPQLIDAKLQPLKKGTQIWGGSIVKLSASAAPYFIPASGAYGVSLRLEGVQVLELVTAGGRSASSLGFEAEEGYDADEGFQAETPEDDAGDSSDDDKTPAGSDDF
jgi:hypothetical protein